MSIIFRTNGGQNIGYGHVYRCLALAKALKTIQPSSNITFIANKECREIIVSDFKFIRSNTFDDCHLIKKYTPKVIIFDSYLASNKYLSELKNISPLVIFDDNNDIYDSSIPSLVINGNIHAEDLDYKTEALLGPKYLVMREEYWNAEKVKPKEKVITITTGGSDINQIMPKFLKNLAGLKFKKNFIIGPGYSEEEINLLENIKTPNDHLIYKPRSLKEYFLESEIVLTAAGSTVYEVLTLNRLPIIYTVADNQKKIANKLSDYGIKYLGDCKEIDFKNTAIVIKKMIKDKFIYNRLIKTYDGEGSFRVADILKEYFFKIL